jgi:hypothetical protein
MKIVTKRVLRGLIALLLLATNLVSAAASIPTVDQNSYWVENVICTAIVKTNFEASRNLAVGNPIEELVVMPANCSGNMMVKTIVNGGVRQLLQSGFRVVSVSHQVTTLVADPTGKAELLISALFALERPTTKVTR